MKYFFIILLSLWACNSFSQTVRIPFDSTNIYDFSGVAKEGCDGLYNYFVTGKDGRITRLVADFKRDTLGNRGYKLFGNAQAEYTLDSICYTNNASSRDTIDIFVFDRNNAPKDDTIDNTRSYTPDFHIITTNPGSGARVRITTSLTMQYFFAVFYQTSCGASCTIEPAVADISFYGHLTGLKDTTYNLFTGAIPWHPRDIGDLYGLNVANVVDDTTWFKANVSVPFTAKGHSITLRNFGYHNEVQRNANAALQKYPNNSYDCNPYNNPVSLTIYNQFLARQGHVISSNRRGTFAYYKYQLTNAGYSGSMDDRWCPDTLGANIQKLSSYYELGNYMYMEAALGGSNASASRTNTRFIHGDSTFGKNYLKYISIGNELEANFFGEQRRNNPNELAKMEIAGYDGDGGIMGAGIGAKNADPNIIVTYQGVASWQWEVLRAMAKRIQLHNRSRKWSGDGMELHTTTTLKTDSFHRNMTSAEQLNNYGVNPEYWGDFRKLNMVYKILVKETGDTSLKLIKSEWATNKNLYTPAYPVYDGTFNQPSYVSQLGTPVYKDSSGTPYTVFQSCGIQVLTIATEDAGTNLYGSWKYQMFDDRGYKEDHQIFGVWYNGIDASNGDFNLRDTSAAWPEHFMLAAYISRFGYYHCIDTLSFVKGGVIAMKFQSSQNPDSFMYFVKIGDTTGKISYNIPTGVLALNCNRWTPSFTSYTGTVTSVAMSSGVAPVTADTMPRYYVVYAPNPAPAFRGWPVNPKIKGPP